MTAIFYGSTTGNTRSVAETLAGKLGLVDACYDIADASPSDLSGHQLLILGVSTWGDGELQDDWQTFLPQLAEQRFEGVHVAVFGLGDANGYPDTFVDGMAELLDAFTARGAMAIGSWPTEGYDFNDSKAVVDGQFVGLVIDEDNESDMTDERCTTWVKQVQEESA